jgi:acetyltransferase-like isoleucine patch superfamily enzyme
MIHESAIIEEASIGKGTNIWHFVHVRKGATIGRFCNIGKGVYIDVNVTIGDNCKIQNFASLYHGLTIGNDVFIGPHVCFTNDMFPRAKLWDEQRLINTHVNDGASIGANATIIAGVTIGKHAMIGAGAVVTKDVPDYGLVYGNPSILKGFVCPCGKRAVEKTQQTQTVELFCSSCNTTIHIPKQVYKELQE